MTHEFITELINVLELIKSVFPHDFGGVFAENVLWFSQFSSSLINENVELQVTL